MSATLEKLHLHIGLEKTGTSSVQLFFADSRAALLRARLLYPLTFRPRPGFDNHAALPALAQVDESDAELAALVPRQPGESRAAVRDRLARSFETEVVENQSRAAVLSSEHLSSRIRSIAEARNALDMLGRVQVGELAVHVMLRNQVDMAASWYATTVKGGDVRHLDQVDPRELFPYLSFADVIDRWRVAAGNAAMRVYSFDELRAQGVDAIAQMRSVTGVPPEIPAARRANLNASLDRKTAEIVRRMNALGRARLPVQNWDSLVEALSSRGGGERIRLPRPLHMAILRAFERENREIERMYFGGRRVLAIPPPKPDQPGGRVQITRDDMARLISELAAELGQPPGTLPSGEEGLLARIAELAEARGLAIRQGRLAAAAKGGAAPA